ncbi:inositol-tetrakisphosphate 1-kinase 2-like [Humulus lupulus]|uniref:inositol-tetrakisphosphate 1-kinase 2-like n=1 Tax=Humulus lupulus TaxID=3486 RepID=UPI002B408679|nr:inositol-tetrakisphosphate 1-kinase 2-like [Humulus lupulus]
MTTTEETTRYRVGYAFEPKKVTTFIVTSFVDLANQNGIDLVPIEPTKPLIEQGPFHCVIHKLYGQQWKQQLIEFTSKYPNAVIIDPPEKIEPLHNRLTMLDSVTRINISQPKTSVGIPKQKVVEDGETIEELGLKYPVIAKPLLANGGTTSHEMWVVLNSKGFESVKDQTPLLVQEYVNHGEVVFKVYVVGDHVECVKRRSLADIHITEEEDGEWSGVSILPFSQISNAATVEHESAKVDDAEMPPPKLVAELGRELRKALGLRLFNFDVIRESEGKYAVIDINYFPGFAKLPHFEQIFTDFLLDQCKSKCN